MLWEFKKESDGDSGVVLEAVVDQVWGEGGQDA